MRGIVRELLSHNNNDPAQIGESKREFHCIVELEKATRTEEPITLPILLVMSCRTVDFARSSLVFYT